jgi:CheY-like chemotaxis protein
MLHILLIEDNTADVMLIREALRTCPIAADVTIASDAEDGLKLLTEGAFKPDLVFLDLSLPKFSGLELLERCPNLPPVVLFSGSYNPADKERAMALGVLDFVQKPIEFQDFIEVIHKIVGRIASNSASAGSSES